MDQLLVTPLIEDKATFFGFRFSERKTPMELMEVPVHDGNFHFSENWVQVGISRLSRTD